MTDRGTAADDAERGQAKHAAAALDCEARRVKRFAPTCAEHMARGARIIRAQAARLDAVLSECAALRKEGRILRRSHVVEAADRIERAAKGGEDG